MPTTKTNTNSTKLSAKSKKTEKPAKQGHLTEHLQKNFGFRRI